MRFWYPASYLHLHYLSAHQYFSFVCSWKTSDPFYFPFKFCNFIPMSAIHIVTLYWEFLIVSRRYCDSHKRLPFLIPIMMLMIWIIKNQFIFYNRKFFMLLCSNGRSWVSLWRITFLLVFFVLACRLFLVCIGNDVAQSINAISTPFNQHLIWNKPMNFILPFISSKYFYCRSSR